MGLKNLLFTAAAMAPAALAQSGAWGQCKFGGENDHVGEYTDVSQVVAQAGLEQL